MAREEQRRLEADSRWQAELTELQTSHAAERDAREEELHQLREDELAASSALETLRVESDTVLARHIEELAGLESELAERGAGHAAEISTLEEAALQVRTTHEAQIVELQRSSDRARASHAAELAQVRGELARSAEARLVDLMRLQEVSTEHRGVLTEMEERATRLSVELSEAQRVGTSREQALRIANAELAAVSEEFATTQASDKAQIERLSSELSSALADLEGVAGEREHHGATLEELQRAVEQIEVGTAHASKQDQKIQELEDRYAAAATTFATELSQYEEQIQTHGERLVEIAELREDLKITRMEYEKSQSSLTHLRQQAEAQIQDLILARLTMEDELKQVQWNLQDPSGEVSRLRDQVQTQTQELKDLRAQNSELLVLVEGLADLEETVDLIPLMADSIINLSRK